jgi:multidrug efflux pump subunit AcrA (membrane-fusion protein)
VASPDEPAPAAAPAADQTTLRVVEVAMRPWPHTVRTQGTLIEDESAVLGTKVAGRVKEVLVDLGMRVETGQVVAKLDTEEFDLKVQQAEAQVAQARATEPTKAPPVVQEMALLEDARLNVQRVRDRLSKGAFTQEEIQTRETAMHVAEARYRSTPIEAKISRISPTLDISSRALMIEADIDNRAGRWRSGLFAEADIIVDADQSVLAVPLTSVVAFGGVEKVWAIKDNKAEPRPIRQRTVPAIAQRSWVSETMLVPNRSGGLSRNRRIWAVARHWTDAEGVSACSG